MQADAAAGTDESINHVLPGLLVVLLKGVVYRDSDLQRWGQLLNLQARVRDYVAVIGLELILDEAEGFAFLRSRSAETIEENGDSIPRLMARRQLSFPVSPVTGSVAQEAGGVRRRR